MKNVAHLYIPYGSDKTVFNESTAPSKSTFISHMVQIKLRYVVLRVRCILLYIPYGSDKTMDVYSFTFTIREALYPIWFR